MGTYSKFSGSLAYSKFFGSFIFQILRISDTIIFLTGIAKIFGTRKRKFGGGRSEEKNFFVGYPGWNKCFFGSWGRDFGGGRSDGSHQTPQKSKEKIFFPRIAPPKKSEPEIWTFFTPQNEFDHYKRPLNRREIWGKNFFSSDLRPKFFSSDLRPAPQNPNLRSGEFFTPQN